jgi:hypothetical protein
MKKVVISKYNVLLVDHINSYSIRSTGTGMGQFILKVSYLWRGHIIAYTSIILEYDALLDVASRLNDLIEEELEENKS